MFVGHRAARARSSEADHDENKSQIRSCMESREGTNGGRRQSSVRSLSYRDATVCCCCCCFCCICAIDGGGGAREARRPNALSGLDLGGALGNRTCSNDAEGGGETNDAG